MKKIKRPRCRNEKVCKVGKPKGKPQHQCKKRKRKFITELNYDEELKKNTIQIFYEGNSRRVLGRIMKINK